MKNESVRSQTLLEIGGETPKLRLFALLETIASKDQFFVAAASGETNIPKPTLHRILEQLEGAGLLSRSEDGRQYATGVRLRKLTENLLLNDTFHEARPIAPQIELESA